MITIIGFSLIFFGSFSIIGIFAILTSTIITNTPWWRKSYRKYHRRLIGISSMDSGKLLSDSRMNHFVIRIIETLSITASQSDGEQQTLNTKNTELGELNQSSAVPLRFQPERLYGSTTTSNGINNNNQDTTTTTKSTVMKHRKSMCSHLMPNIDSTTVMARRPSGSLFPHPFIACGSDLGADNNLSNSVSRERLESPLVRSSLDLSQMSQPERKDSTATAHNFEIKDGNSLIVKVPERRASHASIYGNNSLLDQTSQNGKTDFRGRSKKPEKLTKIAPPKGKSRRSSLSCMVSPFQSSRKAELQLGLSNLTGMIDFQTSLLVNKEITDQKKVPPPPIRNPVDLPAGSMALSIDIEESLLTIRIARAVHLPVHTPWNQNPNFCLKIKMIHNDNNLLAEQSVIPTKCALGCLEFGQHLSPAIVSFPLNDKQHGEELNKICLHFEFVELDKQGSDEVVIATLTETIKSLLSSHQNSVWNKGSVKKIFWHNLAPKNYAGFLTGDALVSLSRTDKEGSVWISIPELRNLEFQNLKVLLEDLVSPKNINVKLKLRVCILSNSKIIRSKKGLKRTIPLSSFISRSKGCPSSQRTGVCNSKFEIKFNENLGRDLSMTQEQVTNEVHFNLSNIDEKIGSKLNYQIIIFLSAAFEYPNSEINEIQKLKAIGRIIISNQGIVMNNCVAESSQQLWKESVLHNGNRVYQWLSIE